MNYIKTTTFLSFVLMLAMTGSAQAANQGINFFYGLGLTAMSSDEKAVLEYDAAAGGEVIFGMEEDGWAFEYSGFRTAEAGTNNAAIDYSTKMTQFSLAYRTLEKGKMYYKIKVGNMTADYDYSDTTALLETEGSFVGVGLGLRTSRDARLELEYSIYSSDDIDTAHMVTLRYLFGGAPYEGAEAF